LISALRKTGCLVTMSHAFRHPHGHF